ncbi:hypothetical protein N7520_003293 [Penicillium odoratum]|uniref:uncharacterized protein n=1 Tax=Penicillium odoratum TaxID=1167516 RepID=UPI002546F415|nr:uncharacterized protein N7520_003293 [Penicillium odoratum]KAJ5768734.1 hypothetical protein N7520_003293 [Penicillium odoratum]
MQNKLLYLSWLPPFSRSEKISDYERECKPVLWQEKRIQSLDGTKLSICEGHIPADTPPKSAQVNSRKKLVVICYFQGNGGSMPLRLPLLSQFLNSIVTRSKTSKAELDETNYIVVGLSYRGYWTSSGTATQSGIERDALAFLTWVSDTYSAPNTDCQMVLWGHSLGAAVASSTISRYLARLELRPPRNCPLAPISGLVMEAPISNIKDMLIALYPQKWLPYRYLWPFSWNTWCSSKALEQLAEFRNRGANSLPAKSSNSTYGGPVRSVPPILILAAEKDEVIPDHVAGQLEQRGQEIGLDVSRQVVLGAMHTECPIRSEGRDALVKFILQHTGPRAGM